MPLGIEHPAAISGGSRTIAYATGVVLFLTLVYAIVQVGFVRPYLPADPVPNMARAPVSAGASQPALAAWRAAYHSGPGSVPTWKTDTAGWAQANAGMIVQVVVFTGAAIVLFILRSNDLTAALSVLALALSGAAGGGPLKGAEFSIPLLGDVLTLFAWLAGPVAFPIIALAVVYFPSPSPLIKRRPWLHVVPFIAASPMLVLGAATGLYLVGIDAAGPLAMWDAAHPAAYYGSFAFALAINVAVIVEGVYRYRFNHDANERRRIRMAVYTTVPGVFAYVLKDGVPIVATLLDHRVAYPWQVTAILQALVLLPAFGLTYAVGVARVLGPALVLRRSLQYALARRTLTAVAILPAIAIVVSLARHQNATIGEVMRGEAVFYLALLAITLAVFRYRDRARQWLDQRFFREEYDARKILVSLAGRVRFETDPADLATLVTGQIDQALHPLVIAMLAAGVEPGVLAPVAVEHGAIGSLPLDGGIASMLRWSDAPLEVFLDDPRSPARRLPADEIHWLEKNGIVLIVPVAGQDRALVGAFVLGAKRSEEAYSNEDRDLLAGIAVQVGLGLDVARLRSVRGEGTDAATLRIPPPGQRPALKECPRCGRCEDSEVAACPSDGTAMKAGSVPRVIDNKYRVEQVLGRGGMGSVYRARDVRLDRLVAVKVVRPELLEENDARRRFRREAQIVARLQHPGIVAIYDFGTLPAGGAYLVMELVRGEDLRRVLQREGRLGQVRAVRIMTAVCAAIEAAHQEGILHRDLKPENILLPTGDVEAKVLDFGVAKLLDRNAQLDVSSGPQAALTIAGTIVGTPAYMAPEQLRADALDARTDVFALGVIAYEMLSGDLPFSRGTLTDVILAQARGVQSLREIQSDVTPALDRAVSRALALTPEDRPATPLAFAAELSGL